MKPGSITAGRILLALFVTGTTIALISWNGKQANDRFQQYQNVNDSVPKEKSAGREKKVRDLDDVLEELDRVDIEIELKNAQKEIERAMKELDGEKIRMQVEQAMKQADFEKIQKEIKESLAGVEIDMAKMQKELKENLKELDGEKMKLELEKVMKEVDFEKIQQEVKESIAKIDMEKIRKELEEVKKINMAEVEEQLAKAKKEIEKIEPQLKEELKKAKVEIEKAKAEMKEYKEFVDELDKEGLIRKNENYTIAHKDGELMINGKKANNSTYLKYKSFLEKHKKFNIEKTNDDFDMDID